MATIYLGIGSNIGDKEANCLEVIERLNKIKDVKVVRRSAFYKTKPVGGPPQDDYLNGVVEISTDLTPRNCLDVVKGIENDMGRMPRGKDHPREIDIDILFYDNSVERSEYLEIPHPRMHKREFVLRGMNELVPDLVHPVLKKTIGELWRSLEQ